MRNGLPEASWGLLGARSASGGHFGRLWAEKGESTNYMDGSWGRRGAILAALGPVLGRIPTPREELGEVFFEGFFGGEAESPQNEHFFTVFLVFGCRVL